MKGKAFDFLVKGIKENFILVIRKFLKRVMKRLKECEKK